MRVESGEGSIMSNFIVCIIHLNIVKVIKSRRMRWAGHVARMEEGRSAFKILAGKFLQERDHYRSLGIDGKTILELTLKK